MGKSFLLKFFIYFYSLLLFSIKELCILVCSKNSKVKKWIIIRKQDFQFWKNIQQQRNLYNKCIIFFCSSAGEYEQSLPLINLLKKEHYVFIFFFSISGFNFAKAKNENLPYTMAPVDIVWIWHKIFRYLKPNVVIINRHEIWPAFVYSSKIKNIPIILINASNSSNTVFSRFFKIKMMQVFDHIFVLSQDDYNLFVQHLAKEKLIISGDTKYDRVFERLEIYNQQIEDLRTNLQKCCPDFKRFIIGSAWKPDVEYALDAYAKIKVQYPQMWQLIIAPHVIDKHMIEWIMNKCLMNNLVYVLFSELQKNNFNPLKAHIDVIIVDIMGILFELYGSCNACMVGGALHHKVHNVLEPAVHGLFLCYGPRFYDQKEAIFLKEQNLAAIIYTVEDLYNFWNILSKSAEHRNVALQNTILKMCGATKLIYDKIKEYIK